MFSNDGMATKQDFALISPSHSQVQDAQATMRLYTLVKKQWEAEIKASRKNTDSEKNDERQPRSSKSKGKNLAGL